MHLDQETSKSFKGSPEPLSFSKCRMAGAATAPACPRTPRRRPATSKAAKRTNAPAQTVAWTRLLNFTAGRRTHTMACAHSELSTGHCGRRIGTKIFQDDSCSPSTRPAERQVRGVVLSKEQGSLPPSAGNTAAPSRFGELLARVISASFLCRLGFHVDVFPHWNSSCSFKGIQEAISEDWSRRLNSRCSRLCASAHPKCVHAVSPSRFQSLIPCGQTPECPMPSNFSCPVRRRRQGETLKAGGESGLP